MYSDFLRKKFAAMESDVVEVASGYPCVLLNSDGKRLKNYTIYGNSGGVGDAAHDGKHVIPVVSRGKNLIRFPYENGSMTKNGITIQLNRDGSFLINGTCSATVIFYLALNMQNSLDKNKEYTLSVNQIVNNAYLRAVYNDANLAYVGEEGTWSSTSIRLNLSRYAYSQINVTYVCRTGGVFDNVLIKPQLEQGTVATEYEPYQAPQRTDIYLDSPIGAGQSVNYKADGLPSIPTVKGTTILEADTLIKPSNIEAKYVKER